MSLATLCGVYLLITALLVFGGYFGRMWLKKRKRSQSSWIKVR